VRQSLLIIEASRSHSDTPHSVVLFWTSDQIDAITSTWQHTTTQVRHTCRWRDSNPQSQQASGRRITPHTSRPLGPATAFPADINCSLQLFKAGKSWIAQQAPSAQGKVWTYLFTYLLPCSMRQSPSWEANRFSASQEIRRILWDWRFITASTSARHRLFQKYSASNSRKFNTTYKQISSVPFQPCKWLRKAAQQFAIDWCRYTAGSNICFNAINKNTLWFRWPT